MGVQCCFNFSVCLKIFIIKCWEKQIMLIIDLKILNKRKRMLVHNDTQKGRAR